ncbi:MAG: beta-ketoadipyl CoA thiolase [Frondihabitans sp.]|nr:beta-ketoadipyl CoA thiolase [Frondihabitans sp.]
MASSWVYDGVRTPFGRYGKGLAATRPDDLAAFVVRELLNRTEKLTDRVEEVVLGDANGAGEDNRNVARMAALLAGLPTSVTGVTVNRLCGSGLEAAIQASRMIETGDAEVVIAGGVESMSRAPWILQKPEQAYPAANQTLHSSTLGWRMVNPLMDERWTIPLGQTAENLAMRFDISREEQDEFAVRSHLNAARAQREGVFEGEIAQVQGTTLVADEGVRPESSMASLSPLKPAFRTDGTVTAGNSSPLNDGATALLIADENADLGREPLARIVSRGAAGNDPDIFGIAPVEAVNRALARAGRTWAQVDVVELNEAFAAQSLACLRLWPDLDPAKVNVDGGAIAIGHPLGASGARILLHLARSLERRGGGVGVAAICIGVGQGLAVVLER